MPRKLTEAKKKNTPERAKTPEGGVFPVVAIGASAGGLDAFTILLKNLPVDTGMAFVLVQHLAPGHESALAKLLSKVTEMPVHEVVSGVAVIPNQVFIIPPNKNLSIRHGLLKLAPREAGAAGYHPIDDFFVSLANDRQSAAIGVILSGNGADGTLGLRAIKAEGGITLAQSPDTAQWPAMPMSAIAAGVADVVLPPDRIGKELVRISSEPYLTRPIEETDGADLEGICTLIRSATGIDFRLYKPATVARRVARRMTLRKIVTLSKYVQYIRQTPSEARELADDIFIHVTAFFRDSECYERLRDLIVPKLHNLPPGEPIRVWVPGCSTGEEAYSMAMLLFDEFGDETNGKKIHVFGTDVSERAIERARAGLYTESALKGVSPERLARYFSKTDGMYQIKRAVREACVFARHDLAKDPPFSRLDLISCRNVLIYMGPALQKRILSVFQYALKPGGTLFLGKSESISASSDNFSSEDQKRRIFSRKPGSSHFSGSHFPSGYRRPEIPGKTSVPVVAPDHRKEAEQLLLARYAPPALIVDADLLIVHFQGEMGPYLSPAAGQPSFHLLKMVRPDLVVDLRGAIQKASTEDKPVRAEGVHFEHNGVSQEITLSVTPINRADGGKFDYLIVFEAALPPKTQSVLPLAQTEPKDAKDEKLVTLERELSTARDYLRSLIAEHETVEEEMKAANEEILSSNEELQITNEELETAKEELQCSNEELITLNEELQHRNIELGSMTSALNSLLVGIDIPVLLLDANLRIQRFTPVAAELFNLIATDIGRPFRQMASNLDVADWDELIRQAKDQAGLVVREVRCRNERWFSLRISPFKTEEGQVEGLLVVLLDIDRVHRALDEARQSGDYARAIVDTIHESLVVLDTDLKVRTANRSFCSLFDVKQADVVGQPFFKLEGGQWDIDGLRERVQGVVSEDGQILSLELDRDFPRIGPRKLVLNVRRSLQAVGRDMIVIAIRDVTEMKAAEEAVSRTESTVRQLIESAAQAIVAVDADGKIVLANRMTEEIFGYSQEELMGMPVDQLIPEDLRQVHRGLQAAYLSSPTTRTRMMGKGAALEGRRKDGSIFPAEVSLSTVQTKDGRLGISFVNDITERRQMAALAESSREEIRALAARLLTIQEEERRRVSRELHDDLCQQLALLSMDVGGLAEKSTLRAADRNRLLVLQGRVVKACEEARHIAYRLHPSVLDDLGLSVAMRGLVEEFSNRGGIHVEFEAGPLSDQLPREIATSLYRSAQEALSNVARHAEAKSIRVKLEEVEHRILLTMDDDGIGFKLEEVKGGGGLGLVSMEERIRLVNGSLSIDSTPGKGTRIRLEVPRPGKSPDNRDERG